MYARRPGAVTHQGDAARIAAKVAHALLDPVQGRDLVQDAEVGRAAAAVAAVGVQETWRKNQLYF